MTRNINTPEGKKYLQELLHNGPVKVIFTKKDGTERIMNCTLKSDLTEVYEKKTDKIKEANPDVCAVYDLDVKGWRSFRFDSIKNIELQS